MLLLLESRENIVATRHTHRLNRKRFLSLMQIKVDEFAAYKNGKDQ